MRKTKRNTYKTNRYTLKQKHTISRQVYDISDDQVLADFNKLRKIGCTSHSKLSLVGNDVVNKFTSTERMNTRGYQGINYYDVLHNRRKLLKEGYVKKMVRFYKQNRPEYPDLKMWFRLSNIYFSSVSIFKPLVAMDVYCRFKPKCILDFTMGWGGRLVGACALDIPKYIGIDSNKNLEQPYSSMKRFLNDHSSTEIDLRFEDALVVDYSKMTYDLVLTSPPYYNIEMYSDHKERTRIEWDNEFYKPLITKTFQHLQVGGHYCLNIPNDVYTNVVLGILGKPIHKIPLAKAKRSQNETYKEYIYVWKK